MQTVVGAFTADQPPVLAQSTMFLILYPQSAEEDVVSILDEIGVSGYTETDKVIGRGPRGHHFDTQIWPGADGMIYCVVDSDKRDALANTLGSFNQALERKSKGLYGLHIFTWTCDQLI
jgi:hypothetical protein